VLKFAREIGMDYPFDGRTGGYEAAERFAFLDCLFCICGQPGRIVALKS